MNYRDKINFKIIVHGSDEYRKAVKLREEILRKPLGLSFLPEELELEKNQIHIAGFLEGELCATAVLVPKGDEVKMQRVAIEIHLQNKGVGTALMSFCEDCAKGRGFKSIYCHARETAISFYLKNNYTLEGEPFEEQRIPHHKMRKILRSI